MKKFQLLFLLQLLFIGNPVFGQKSPLPPFVKNDLDNYMKTAMEQWQVPGAAIAIIKDGKVILMKGYGVLEEGKPEKVDENTLFMIGSNTKAFTGTSMSLLANEGKCSLNDRVKQWLPEFTMKDPWVADHVNLTDILCHRLGMETFQGDFMYWTSDLTIEQVMEKFGKLTPEYDFRSKWGYTNAAFAIAGLCIGKISGIPWAEFVKQNILSPLNMDHTLTSSMEIRDADNAARPYTIVDGKLTGIPYPEIDDLAPAGSISSSVSDMSHWVLCLLDSGKYQGKQIIPWEVIARTRQPESIEGEIHYFGNASHFELYGLGWELSDYYGREIVSHTGGVNGFSTSVTLLPEEKLGIIVFTDNDTTDLYSSAKWDIMNAMLGIPFQDVNARWYSAHLSNTRSQERWLKEKRDSVMLKLKPEISLDAFTGKYMNDAYGYTVIRRENNHLVISFQHHPDLTGKLESLGGSRFLCTYSDPEFGVKVIPFVIDDGKVKSFTLHVADFIEYTGYDFIKED